VQGNRLALRSMQRKEAEPQQLCSMAQIMRDNEHRQLHELQVILLHSPGMLAGCHPRGSTWEHMDGVGH
jgi:hypothetical protein